MDTIRHYANFPATGVSLRQMVQFGERPSVGKMIPEEYARSIGVAETSKVPCSERPNSCPRSCPFDSRIVSKSSEIFQMA